MHIMKRLKSKHRKQPQYSYHREFRCSLTTEKEKGVDEIEPDRNST